MHDCQLPRETVCRDLGVLVTADMSPSQHISEIVSKAHKANHVIRLFLSQVMLIFWSKRLLYM